jgi:hypothetical protein
MDIGHRWLGVGHSARPDPHLCGAEAARRALRGSGPVLLIVFAAGVADPAAVLAGIRTVCPGVPLIGCSSELIVTADGAGAHGVVVTALGGAGFTVRTGHSSCSGGAQRRAGEAVASCGTDIILGGAVPGAGDAAPADGGTGHRAREVLMLLTDGWVADQEEILAGAYTVVGARIPVIGGSAGPDPAAGRPYLMHDESVLHGAVVGAVIASTGPLGFGIRHGLHEVGEPMIVTRSAPGRVLTLDDRPAVTAYLDRYGAPGPAYTDPAEFERFAQSRPIGIRRRNGVEVRSVSSSSSLADGVLCPIGEVPQGALVWSMEGDAESATIAAADAVTDAVGALGTAPPLGLLAFDCVSRSHMLGDEGTHREVRRMLGPSAGAPLTGIYTWGEILRTAGVNGFHNQTLAVLAVG